MQSLNVADRLFPLVLSGEKTHTIRWRETRIRPGLMRYVCDRDPGKTVVVLVTRCRDVPLSQAAMLVGKQDIWPDAIMLSGMREHYPDIQLDDVVQVVEHMTPQQTATVEASQ
ncbi:MAG: ASCH domain-containing protein [Hyphomicrobiales bacterium]|nr:ASCH domain-containing protein [Hyphomicrobiales bacterium]